MNKKDFFDLLWRVEEILMQRDHLRKQIGKCGGDCDIEDDGLCSDCCTAFEKVWLKMRGLLGTKSLIKSGRN